MRKIFLMAMIAVALALATVACGDKGDEPETQNATITTSFGDITVTGFFTNAEWEGVPDKIKTALNNAHTFVGSPTAGIISAKSITVIVEKNPSYANYSTTFNGNTIHINYAIVNNASNLQTAINRSCWVLSGDDEVPTVG